MLLATSISAWYDTSYYMRVPINCSQSAAGMVVLTNITLNGTKQILWTNCQSNLSIYYNSNLNYTVANDTSIVPFEVVFGNGTSVNPATVWGGFNYAGHFSLKDGKQKVDSSGNLGNVSDNSGAAIFNLNNGMIGDGVMQIGIAGAGYAQINNSDDGKLNPTTAYTACVYATINVTDGYACKVMGQAYRETSWAAPYNSWAIVTRDTRDAARPNNKIAAEAGITGSDLYADIVKNVTNEFYWWCGTYDNKSVRAYFKGALNSTTTAAGPIVYYATTNPIIFGTRRNGDATSGETWKGAIDEAFFLPTNTTDAWHEDLYNTVIGSAGYGKVGATEEYTAPGGTPIHYNQTVLYLTMNANNATGVHDYSGFNNNTVVSEATWTPNGKFAGAYTFNALNSTINITKNDKLNFSARAFTTSVWVLNNNWASTWDAYILADYSGGGIGGWYVSISNLNPTFSCYNGTNQGPISPTDIPTGWVNIVSVYDKSNASLYVNGILKDTDQIGVGCVYSAKPITIGHYYASPALTWNGSIDEVRIWSYALNSTQVSLLYNRTYITYANIAENQTFLINSTPPKANFTIDVENTLLTPYDPDFTVTLVNFTHYYNQGDIVIGPDVYNSAGHTQTLNYTTTAKLGLTKVNIMVNDSFGNNVNFTRRFNVYSIEKNLTQNGVYTNAVSSNVSVQFGQDIAGNCSLAFNKTTSGLFDIWACNSVMLDNNGAVKLNCTVNPVLYIEEKFDVWVSCKLTDSYVYNEVVNSSKVSIWIDNYPPEFDEARFDYNGQMIRSRNITGQFNMSDSNIFRVNVTLDGTILFNKTNMNVTVWNYTLNRNVNDLSVGSHNFAIEAWDAHTAEAIGDYDVKTNILSNEIEFDTGTNTINIKAVDNGFTIANPFTAAKDVDRYTFDYYPKDIEKEIYVFEVETKDELHIVEKPDQKWKRWLVSGNHWIDFYQEANPDLVPVFTRLDYNKVSVEVAAPIKVGEAIEFSSVGDLNRIQMNWTFYVFNVTIDYDAVVDENEPQSVYLTIINGSTSTNWQAAFWLNSSLLFGYKSINTTTILLNSTFTTPQFNATAILTNRWQLNYTGDVNNLYFNQTVMRSSIDDCSVFNTTALTFTLYSENQPFNTLNGSLEFMVDYWQLNKSNAKTYSSMKNNSYYFEFCIANDTQTYYMDLYAQDTVPTGFTHRYYIYNSTLNSSVQGIYLYNFNYTAGISTLKLTLRDYFTNNYLEDYVVKLQRLYVGEGIWRTVQHDKTDDFGLVIFNVVEQSVDYRLIIQDTNNTVYVTTNTMKFACSSGLCELTYQLDRSASTTAANDVNVVWVYSSSTKAFNLTWDDPLAATNTVNTSIIQNTYTGIRTLCSANQVGAAGEVDCDTSGYTGSAFIEVKTNGEAVVAEWLELNTSKLGTSIGNDEGAFWAALIILTCAMFGLASPAIALISMVIGLIAVFLIGIFTPMTVTMIILATLIGIFIGWKVRQ